MKPVIVFVYNADSGIFNTMTDIAHKIFSPETYSCNLCAITYGKFSIREEWKTFLETLDANMEFLHRNELEEQYGLTGVELPAALLKTGQQLELWITSKEINECKTIEELKNLVTGKLNNR